jgi:hypothetical protein
VAHQIHVQQEYKKEDMYVMALRTAELILELPVFLEMCLVQHILELG